MTPLAIMLGLVYIYIPDNLTIGNVLGIPLDIGTDTKDTTRVDKSKDK